MAHMLKKLMKLSCAALCCAFAGLAVSAQALYVIPDAPIPLADGKIYVLSPETGSLRYSSGGATLDYSNASEGYIMASYSGWASKIKIQITRSGGTTYTYNLNSNGSYEVFPLTAGDGVYNIGIFENVSGSQYAQALNTSIDVALRNSLLPFLYPSQYVNFDADSATVAKGAELARTAASQLAVVTNVYNYVVKNIKYDDYKAKTVQSGYLPQVDSILASGKGICFDFAAVTAAMLRSQNIPTRLQVGYVSGGVYHAWISVYTTETGWINNIIYFDGKTWKLMDPTFASSAGQSQSIMQFIGNGSNYSTMYVY